MIIIKNKVRLSEAKEDFGSLGRLANKLEKPICIVGKSPNEDLVLINREEYERRINTAADAMKFFLTE